MEALGLDTGPKVNITDLFNNYADGEWIYRLTSGLAHRRQWTTLFAFKMSNVEHSEFGGTARIVTDETWTVFLTSASVRDVGLACLEYEAYIAPGG